MTEARLVSVIEDTPIWVKFSLGEVHCIEKVLCYVNDGTVANTWTCKDTDCEACEGPQCEVQLVTVSIKQPDLHDHIPVPVCRYGDNVLIEKDREPQNLFTAAEIVIKGKEGNKLFLLLTLRLNYASSLIEMLLGRTRIKQNNGCK